MSLMLQNLNYLYKVLTVLTPKSNHFIPFTLSYAAKCTYNYKLYSTAVLFKKYIYIHIYYIISVYVYVCILIFDKKKFMNKLYINH
jgi:hypothetical protein